MILFLLASQNTQRAYSIKTRIKTHLLLVIDVCRRILREHIPLKQGLRQQDINREAKLVRLLREHIPLKQGLRLPFERAGGELCRVLREHIPLKQGLRRRKL